MSQLALYFLGTPRIERDGKLMEVDTRKALAMVAYLAVTGQAQGRDTLAALLWPEYDEQHARGALRRTLSALRSALGAEWLAVVQDQVGLQTSPDLWIDVRRFQEGAQAARGPAGATLSDAKIAQLAQAVDLYRDDFLAGFTLRDSSAFDDWQFTQSEALRHDLGQALERLVQEFSRRSEYEQAIPYARRWLGLDSLHEPAHRQLMRLYAAAGQPSAALRQYNECVRVLQQELGVAPLEETTRLYEEIREQRRSPAPLTGPGQGKNGAAGRRTQPGGPAGTSAPPAGRMVASPVASTPAGPAAMPLPFVGRAAEWAALTKAYATAGEDGHLAVLEGEAGIGKTRLAEEFLGYAASRGAATTTARCYQGEAGLAYAPFVEALRGILRRPLLAARWQGLAVDWLAEAARLLPELRVQSPAAVSSSSLDGPGAQARFFEAVSQLLAAALGDRSAADAGVLFFDDVQWMDAASLDLLAYMVRRLRGMPLWVLLAWRSDEVPAGHPLRRLLAETERLGRATALLLPRLGPGALSDMLAQLPQAGRQLAERLHKETEGLPFFVAEYLAALAGGALAADASGWATPEGVRSLIHARLAPVGGAGRQLLSAAAVIGRSFEFDTLRDVSGRSDEETVAGLEEMLGQGLIREVAAAAGGQKIARSGPYYDFVHDKLCDVVYEETSLARRRLLHRRVAETLVSQGRATGQPAPGARGEIGNRASVIAQHYQMAGLEHEAAEYFHVAGDHAAALYANVEALAHFESALALGHPDQTGLHEAIGDVQTLLGDYGAALRSYDTARALAATGDEAIGPRPAGLGRPGESGPVVQAQGMTDEAAGTLPRLEHKLGSLHLRRGEWALAAGHFRDALAGIPEDGTAGLRSHLYADWSLAAYRQGQTEEALGLAQHAYRLAAAAGDRQARGQAENTLGMLAKGRGDLNEACAHFEAGLALAEATGDMPARVAAMNNLALTYAESGQFERALDLTEEALALCTAIGDRHHEAALHNNLADLLHAAGNHEAAMAHLKQAVTIFAEIRVEAGEMQPEIWKLAEW